MPGGGERYVGALARGLVASGQRVTVVTGAAVRESQFWEGAPVGIEAREERLTLLRLPIRRFPGGRRGLMLYRKAMVFFDARDPAQLRKARQLVEAAEAEALEVKPILVGGSPVQVMEQWQRRVFFDQGGVLVRKFGIKAVPATVRRAGDVLQVEEVPPT